MTRESLTNCPYCGCNKSSDELSHEHFWPTALGGDLIHDVRRSDDVCRVCNNRSGVFVDGAFIKSFAVMSERTTDALAYLPTDRLMVPRH